LASVTAKTSLASVAGETRSSGIAGEAGRAAIARTCADTPAGARSTARADAAAARRAAQTAPPRGPAVSAEVVAVLAVQHPKRIARPAAREVGQHPHGQNGK
jgi:hypothetical protein